MLIQAHKLKIILINPVKNGLRKLSTFIKANSGRNAKKNSNNTLISPAKIIMKKK